MIYISSSCGIFKHFKHFVLFWIYGIIVVLIFSVFSIFVSEINIPLAVVYLNDCIPTLSVFLNSVLLHEEIDDVFLLVASKLTEVVNVVP